MTLTLDRRESALSEALRSLREHYLKDLPVGDVHCRYDDGTEWVLERKTARDLANSIRRGLILSSKVRTGRSLGQQTVGKNAPCNSSPCDK